MIVLRSLRGGWRWLAIAPFLMILAVWAADKIWPLPLHEVNPARVVVAHDGTPLWRFADAEGIWRYPVTIEDVSPRYLDALINYEDRWFWQHPGVNPFSVLRAAWQDLSSGRVISGGSTLTMQVARLLDPHPRTFRRRPRVRPMGGSCSTSRCGWPFLPRRSPCMRSFPVPTHGIHRQNRTGPPTPLRARHGS